MAYGLLLRYLFIMELWLVHLEAPIKVAGRRAQLSVEVERDLNRSQQQKPQSVR